MKRALLGVLVLLAAGLLAYARGGEQKPAGPPGASFGGVSLKLEYAVTEAEREKGLGGRMSLMPQEAMLFVFPKDGYYGFWMKDTLISLDMFWLDAQGHVVFIERDVAPSTYPSVFYPDLPARYVLETAAGDADRYGIRTGDALRLQNVPIVSQ